MKILIIVFSGTGNTARIAGLLRREFERQSHSCEITPMEKIVLGLEPADFSKWDLVGIGFPVHAMDAPEIVYNFLAMLPGAKMRYFLFKTAGSKAFNAGSSYRIRQRLANLGWKLMHEALYEMPPNSFGSARQRKVNSRYFKACTLAKQSAKEIVDEIRIVLPDPALRKLLYRFGDWEKLGATKLSSKWAVNSACTLCRICATGCPTKNIEIQDGKLLFKDSCILCLRCWWNCPSRAISHKILKPFLLKEPYKLPPLEDNPEE
jgi:ferredoxin/flavodoxin